MRRPLKINGKTQFPQLPVDGDGDGEGEGDGDGDGEGEGEGEGESPQVPDSSPTACIAILFWIKTAALLETPATPSGVPVTGYILSGLE